MVEALLKHFFSLPGKYFSQRKKKGEFEKKFNKKSKNCNDHVNAVCYIFPVHDNFEMF